MQQSLNWPSVDGTVLESRVITSPAVMMKAAATCTGLMSSMNMRPAVTSKPTINMSWEWCTPPATMKKSQETVARYPVGRAVKVYVNPANPAKSTLEQKGSTTASLVIGIVLVVIGLCGGIPALIGMVVSLFNVTSTTGF